MDFNSKTNAFVTWLYKNGVHVSTCIRIQDLRSQGKGRGIIAARDIRRGKTLFRHKDRSTIIGGVVDVPDPDCTIDVKGNPWICLLLQLLVEYGRYLTRQSRWNEYFDLLPARSEEFDTLMYWTDKELSELQASSVIGKIGKRGAEVVFRTLLPEIKRRPSHYGFPKLKGVKDDVFEAAFFARAHFLSSLMTAYAFDVEPVQLKVVVPNQKVKSSNVSNEDDEEYQDDADDEDEYDEDADEEEDEEIQEDELLPRAMVPLADLLNADGDRHNASLYYESAGSLVMRATRDIKKGDEIFNDYGPLPRSELLRKYGYVTNRYAQYDIVEIPLSIWLDSASSLLGHKQDRLLQRLAKSLKCQVDELPTDFELSRAKIKEMKRENLMRWNALEPLINSLTIPIREAAVKVPKYIEEVLECRLRQYATTLRQDEDWFDDNNAKMESSVLSTSDRRLDMALEVIIGEKQLLEDALALIRRCNDGEAPKRKRAKVA